jgi:hypothetical protein
MNGCSDACNPENAAVPAAAKQAAVAFRIVDTYRSCEIGMFADRITMARNTSQQQPRQPSQQRQQQRFALQG